METYEITLLKVRLEELKQEVAVLRRMMARLINHQKGERDEHRASGSPAALHVAEGV